jgi:hypothetical protein
MIGNAILITIIAASPVVAVLTFALGYRIGFNKGFSKGHEQALSNIVNYAQGTHSTLCNSISKSYEKPGTIKNLKSLL